MIGFRLSRKVRAREDNSSSHVATVAKSRSVKDTLGIDVDQFNAELRQSILYQGICVDYHLNTSGRSGKRETCWLQRSYIHHNQLETKIRAKHDATEILHSTNGQLQNLPARDAACVRQWMLIHATRYNHIALVNAILANKTFDHNARVHCNLLLPIFFAIRNGDVALVKSFLGAGSSPTISMDFCYSENKAPQQCVRKQPNVSKNLKEQTCTYEFDDTYRYLYKVLSAVEYACLVNQPKVLELLVSYNVQGFYKLWPTKVDDEYATNLETMRLTHRPQDTNILPLHAAIALLTKVYDLTIIRKIPSLVQVIIDAGANVHSVDVHDRAPLEFLLSRVKFVRLKDHSYAITHLKIIVEITEILLKAGASVTGGRKYLDRTGFDPLNVFLKVIRKMSKNLRYLYPPKSYLEKARIARDFCRLAKVLTYLLFTHGAELTSPSFVNLLPATALYMMGALSGFSFFSDTTRNEGYHNEVVDEISSVCTEAMDLLISLNRYFVIAGERSLTNQDWSELLNEHRFISTFIEIANCSDQECRSEKLSGIILTGPSASNVNKLRNALLLPDEQNPVINLNYSRRQLDWALKYFRSEDARNVLESLQCLAIRVIRRALQCRVLLREESFGVGLPPKLEALIRP